MNKPKDYKHIKAWGVYMGSFSGYIEDEQLRAATSNAPLDALFRDIQGIWQTVDSIADQKLKQKINIIVEEEHYQPFPAALPTLDAAGEVDNPMLKLSGLLRGLECDPTIAVLPPSAMFKLGQQIATQAKKAPDAETAITKKAEQKTVQPAQAQAVLESFAQFIRAHMKRYDGDAGCKDLYTFRVDRVVEANSEEEAIAAIVDRDALAAAPALPTPSVDALKKQNVDLASAAKECLQDLVSHHSDFREACEKRADALIHGCDPDSAAYWHHQMAVLDRMKRQAEAALTAIENNAPAPQACQEQSPVQECKGCNTLKACQYHGCKKIEQSSNFYLLIDELILSWQAKGNDKEQCLRRVAARAALEAAIAAQGKG